MSKNGTIKRVRASLPEDDRVYVDALLADPCSYCGNGADFLDHIQAEKRGGSTTWDNVTPVCRECNSSKGPASLLGYLGWLIGDDDRRRILALMANLTELNRAWRAV